MKVYLAIGTFVTLATGLVGNAKLPAWGERLGWTLIHSLWQVTLIAAVALVVNTGLRRWSAQTRYVVGVLFLGLMLIVPGVTWTTIAITPLANEVNRTKHPERTNTPTNGAASNRGAFSLADVGAAINPSRENTLPMDLAPAPSLVADRMIQPISAADSSASLTQEMPPDQTVLQSISRMESIRQTITPWLGQIVALWLTGVFVYSIRPIAGLWTQLRLQRVGLSAVSEDASRMMLALAHRMKVSHVVRIAESALVKVPMVVGYLKPIILLPASVVIGMAPDQLESLLAHELAHIRRHDWIINAIQVVIETLLFYHPAVWWLSRRIRYERELCCDDLALGAIGDKLIYGRMLLALEELRQDGGFPALAATGGDLVQRIHRLLPHRAHPQRSAHGWFAGTMALALLAVLFVGWLAASPSDAVPQQAAADLPSPSVSSDSSPLREVSDGNRVIPPRADEKRVVRGRIVTEDRGPLPKDLKLQRRITGSNFAEWPKDVSFNDLGEFAFEVPYPTAFVRVYATSSEFAPGSSNRFEVKRGQSIEPITITLPRGITAQLRLRAADGTQPTAGTATVRLRNSFEPTLGVFAVGQHGDVTIAHCPDEPVQIDLLMPGFEEQRIHRPLSADRPIELVVRQTPSARMQLVNRNGQPVAGALVRLFSRVRSDSFLAPRMEPGDGPVWATSDAEGRIELTTLCVIDPVPTNDPGPAEYAFRIDAPGLAPYYIGNVRAGSNLGQIQLDNALTVQGEIIRNAKLPERVRVQWRQPTVPQGGASGKGSWIDASLSEVDGRLLLKLTGLRTGQFDLFVVYSDPNTPENSFGGSIKQLEFHGMLTSSSANLEITRETVTPGDKNLTAARASLFPIDEMPPSNVPKHVVRQLIAQPESSDDGTTIELPKPPRLKPLFSWSHTSPVQHSMGHVSWHLFVLEDGTVIVPPRIPQDAGARHKLSLGELQELTAILDRHSDLWGLQVPNKLPDFAGWRNGHEAMNYTRNGQTKSLVYWEVPENTLEPGVKGDKEAIARFLDRLIVEAKCGGRNALKSYRDLANRVLTDLVAKAKPLTSSDWCSATIETDGTRTITFSNQADRSEVRLVHPVGGAPYVEIIEYQNVRIAVVDANRVAWGAMQSGEGAKDAVAEGPVPKNVPLNGGEAAEKPRDPAPPRIEGPEPQEEAALTIRLDGRKPMPQLMQVELTLDRKEYLLGESITVDYAVKNVGDIPVLYDPGGIYPDLRLAKCYVMSAIRIDDSGKPLGDPVLTWPMPDDDGGIVSNSVLQPGERTSTLLFVTRYLRFLEPGRYRLKIRNEDRSLLIGKGTGIVYSEGETILTLREPTLAEARGVFEAMKRAPRKAYDDGTIKFQRGAADFLAMHQPVYLPILQDYASQGDVDALHSLERMGRADANAVVIEAMNRALDRDDWQAARECFRHLKDYLPFPNWYYQPLTDYDRPHRERVERCWRAEFSPAVIRLARRLNKEVDVMLEQRRQQPVDFDARDEEFVELLFRGMFPKDHPQSLLVDIDFIYRCVGRPDDLVDCLSAYAKSVELTKTLPMEKHQYFRPRGSASGFLHTIRFLIERGAKPPVNPTHPGEAAAFALALHANPNFRPDGWKESFLRWLKGDSPYLSEVMLGLMPQPVLAEVLDDLPRTLASDYVDLQIAACHVAKRNPRPEFRDPLQRILDTAKDEYLRKYAVDAARANGLTADYDPDAPFVTPEERNSDQK